MMLFVSRVSVLLHVVLAVNLLEVSSMGVDAQEMPTPLRQLEEMAKVHIKVHQQGVGHATKDLHEGHTKEEEQFENKNGVSDDNETGHITSNDAKAMNKYGKAHYDKNVIKQPQNNEIVTKYDHGSVRIANKNDGIVVTKKEPKSNTDNAMNGATMKEKEGTGTAHEAKEIATTLSSTSSANEKSFHNTYGPVVIICGVIGGLAAIVGVAGLVLDHPQSLKNSLDSNASADLGVDVEAHVAPVDVQDDDCDSDSSNDDDEEGEFTNGTTHVSV